MAQQSMLKSMKSATYKLVGSENSLLHKFVDIGNISIDVLVEELKNTLRTNSVENAVEDITLIEYAYTQLERLEGLKVPQHVKDKTEANILAKLGFEPA